jgi:hypothetical protein
MSVKYMRSKKYFLGAPEACKVNFLVVIETEKIGKTNQIGIQAQGGGTRS